MFDNTTLRFNKSKHINESQEKLQEEAATLSDFCIGFAYFYYTVVSIVIFIGIIGNIITIKMMWPSRRRSPTSFLLIVLAVCDFFVCFGMFWSTTFLNILKVANVSPQITILTATYWRVLISPFVSTFSVATCWVVLQVAIHRYVVVCLPHKTPTFGTIKVARYQAIFAITFSVIFTIPQWFEHHFLYKDGAVVFFVFRESYDNPLYQVFYKVVLYYLVIFFIPVIVLTVLTYKLIKTLLNANISREQMTRRAQDKHDITVSLITVVVIFVVCQCINPLRRLVSYYVPDDEKECPNPLYFLNCLSLVANLANSSANFIIYIVCAKRFRQRLRSLCCQYKIVRVEPEQLQTNATNETEIC